MKVLQPMNDVVLVTPITQEEQSGGIILPDSQKEKPQLGTIFAVGNGKYEMGQLVPMRVKVGDTILFRKFAGTEIEFENQKYLVMREGEIICVISEQ